MNRMFIALLLVSLAGCAPSLSQPFTRANLGPTERVYIPPIGMPHEAAIGSTMISLFSGKPAAGFVAVKTYQPDDIVFSSATFHYDPIPEGSEWAIVGMLPNGDFLCRNNQYVDATFNGMRSKSIPFLVVNQQGEAYGFANEHNGGVVVSRWSKKPDVFLTKYDRVFLMDSFKQVLIYSGRFQQTVKLSYRESTDDFTRPSFAQELSYDLSERNVVGFRGMQIEIIEATDSMVKFVIERGLE